MKVEFSASALADPASMRHLTALWWLMEDGRHQWIVPDLDLVRDSAWLAEHGPTTKRAIAEHAHRAGRRSRQPDVVVESTSSAISRRDGRWHVPAERAAAWLRRPVIVVVENGRVDGGFLRVVALRVGEAKLKRKLSEQAFQRLKDRWRSPMGDGELLDVRHGGGSTTAMVVELVAEFDALPPRLLVVVDSDRVVKGGSCGGTADTVLTTCAKLPDFGCGWEVKPWVSEKREVENYLPLKAIEAATGKAAPAASDYEDLKERFGRNLATKVFQDADDLLHERALREQCGDNGRELDQLVDRLVALL